MPRGLKNIQLPLCHVVIQNWVHRSNFKNVAGFELAIRESRFADRIYFFADHFKHFL